MTWGELRQRQPRERNGAYLSWLSRAPCIGCMARGRGLHNGVQLAHLRASSLEHGKRETGKSEKPSDRWCTPLCEPEHRRQHGGGELAFWTELGVDPFLLCKDLYAAYEAGASSPAPIIARHAGYAQRARQEKENGA